MSGDAPRRTFSRLLCAALLVGLPGLLSAAQTIDCDAPLLVATPPQGGARLGWAISAGETENQKWLAAGADHDNAEAGSVSMYRDPGPGTPQTGPKIIPGDPQSGDQFGSSVSISGNWLAVGAPGKAQDTGAVYLFQRTGDTWAQKTKLAAADAAQSAQFGFSVSLSETTLVVGAPGGSGNGSSSGAAYVFELQGDSWRQTQKLLANDGRPFDKFGSSVAIAGSGIVVGAPFADDLQELRNFGAAYVFTRSTNGGWTLEANGKLTAGAFRSGNIQFGSSVAMGGGRIAVGAPGDDRGFTDSGAAYVFERNGAVWMPHLLLPEDREPSEQLGTAVQIAGNQVLVGAPFDGVGSQRLGAAYLFERQSNASWELKFKIRHDPGGAFGQSVARLGDQVFLGGFQFDVGAATDAGAVATCSLGPDQTPCPTITKTDHRSTVDPGQTVTYQIDVRAARPGATVSDTFPSKLEAVSWCRGAGCTDFVQQALTDSLTAGGDATYLVRGRVRAGATGQLTNKACVEGGGCAQVCATDTDLIEVQGPGPEPFCVKTGPDTVAPGSTITYEITVGNGGNQAANGVVLEDPGSPGLQFISASAPCGGGFPCLLGTIGPDQSLPPVTATFRVLEVQGCRETIVNTASVDGVTCSKETALLGSELGVNVSAPAGVPGGAEHEASVVVSNAGPVTARNVPLDVTITGAGSVTQIPAGCAAVPNDPGHFTCALAEIGCGGSTTLVFRIKSPVCPACVPLGPITVTAKVQTVDANPANDQDSAQTQVSCPSTADLAITKSGAPNPVAPGDELLYTITVRNLGCLDVTGATVTDMAPAGLTSVRWCRDVEGPCNPFHEGDLQDSLSLAAGATATYRMRGIVPPMCTGTLVNTATVSPPQGVAEPNNSNNTAMATSEISPPLGLAGICTSGDNVAFEGDLVSFTFVLIAGPNGQSDNPGNEFTDVLPAGLTLVSVSATSGTAVGALNTATWNGSLPPCGTVTITVNAIVNAGTAGMTFCDQAMIFFDTDGDGINESSAAASGSCCLKILSAALIPTLSETGLAALSLLLAALAVLRLRRRSL